MNTITNTPASSIRNLEAIQAKYVRLTKLQDVLFNNAMNELARLGFSDWNETVDNVTEFLDNNPESVSATKLVEDLQNIQQYGIWPNVIVE